METVVPNDDSRKFMILKMVVLTLIIDGPTSLLCEAIHDKHGNASLWRDLGASPTVGFSGSKDGSMKTARFYSLNMPEPSMYCIQ